MNDHENNHVTVTKPDGTVVLGDTTDQLLIVYTGGAAPEGTQNNFLNGSPEGLYSLALSFLVNYEESHPDLILSRAKIMKSPHEAMIAAIDKMLGGAGKEKK